MTYLYFYLVTRVLIFLFLALYLRIASVSKQEREGYTFIFIATLVPVASDLLSIFLIPFIITWHIFAFVINYIHLPINFFYQLLNGRPNDA